jgi:hypothetical protein
MLHPEASIFPKTSKPLPAVAARKRVVKSPYVDTTVDAARLEARATHAKVTDSDGRGSKSEASFMEARPSGVAMSERGGH